MSLIDLDQARYNMIHQQIRPWEVTSDDVLDLLGALPRDEFVPAAYRNLAYSDLQLPIGHGQVMMPPKVEARMLQALAVQPSDKVLEIGTGSGYVTALLARCAAHVDSVEIFSELSDAAAAKLADNGISNVTLTVGDAGTGWTSAQRYDAIAITGSLPLLPDSFQRQLSIGGRLFAIVGQSPAMEALLITRLGENEWATESLFETDLPALLNAPRPPEFVF